MKGLTLVSAVYEKYLTDRYQILFNMIRDEFGFPIQYSDDSVVPGDVDVVFVALQRTYTGSMMKLEHLDRRVKMIGLIGDIHSLDYKYGNGVKMLARYDVILVNAMETALRTYPQFADKMIHFPVFFASHERYVNLPYNKQPKMRCLLAGSINPPREYPLRHLVATFGDPDLIDQLPYPGSHIPEHAKFNPMVWVGDKFAQVLNQYFCCITSSEAPANEIHPTLRTVIAKHVEIPAAGSLLLVEPCEDARRMGLAPWLHFVPVERGNVLERIKDVLGQPESYEAIRSSGMALVRARHSVNNRMQQLREVMDQL